MPGDAQSLVRDLQECPGLSVRSAVRGADLTTYAIGGPLEFLLEPDNPEQLSQAVQTLSSHQHTWRILGAGSNVLLSSQGLPGCFLRLGRGFRYVNQIEEGVFQIGGASSLMTVSRDLSNAGWSGLEFAGGIPGTMGGAVCMNAGAHGRQLSDVVVNVRIMLPDGTFRVVSGAELRFGYRSSCLPCRALVVEVQIVLKRGDPANTGALRQRFLEERRKRQPLSVPSAGSVFRNPEPARSAGFLIEQCGLKGQRRGGAVISELHANWILNEKRQATHQDVVDLMQLCQSEVAQKFGVDLQPEIKLWLAG